MFPYTDSPRPGAFRTRSHGPPPWITHDFEVAGTVFSRSHGPCGNAVRDAPASKRQGRNWPPCLLWCSRPLRGRECPGSHHRRFSGIQRQTVDYGIKARYVDRALPARQRPATKTRWLSTRSRPVSHAWRSSVGMPFGTLCVLFSWSDGAAAGRRGASRTAFPRRARERGILCATRGKTAVTNEPRATPSSFPTDWPKNKQDKHSR